VGVDPKSNALIAAGKIKICNTIDGKVGKIASVVTHKRIRGKGYGKLLIKILT
jgi:predicted GNAT family acetyltransferase